MSWMTSDEKWILIAVFAVLMFVVVYYELRIMRGKSKEVRQVSQKKDEAFNSILTTRHVVNVVQRQGRDTRTAQSILEEAKYALQKGDYDQAMDLAEKARHELTHPSLTAQDETSSARDLEKVAEEVLATPNESENLYTGTKLPDDQTGSYLSAQFELNAARDDIRKAVGLGKDVTSATVLMSGADAAFEKGQYTKVLSLAVRARKAIGIGGAIETIPLKATEPESIEEEPPLAPDGAMRKLGTCGQCGEHVEKDDAFCGSCGARVVTDRTCENCGAKAKPTDKFCRKCGGKVL